MLLPELSARTLGLLVVGGALGTEARALLAVAFLGAYTTMSTFAYESVVPLESGRYGPAALNFLLNPVLWVVGALALPAAGT